METFDVSISFLEEYFVHPMFERVKNVSYLLVEQKEYFQVGCLTIKKNVGSLSSQPTVPKALKRLIDNSSFPQKPSKFPRAEASRFDHNLEGTEIEIVSPVQEVNCGPKKAFACELCPFRSQTRATVRKHILMTHSPNCPRYHCVLCSSVIKERGNMKRHYVQVHSMTDNDAYAYLAQTNLS